MGIDPGQVGVILLAAGQSRRFGHADKLLHPWRGEPLALHAARTLAGIGFGTHVAVAGSAIGAILPPVFRTFHNPAPDKGLASSIAIGVGGLQGRPLTACLLALADMPLVPADHILGLLAQYGSDTHSMIGTRSPKGRAMVPALFGSAHFAALSALDGDHGARTLLYDAPTVACDPAWLADFDQEADFGA